MKNLNRLLFLSLIMTCLSPLAQTKEIAWKSHSGKMKHFNPQQDGDLGLFIPPATLISVQKVNDTTFIESYINTHYTEYNRIDTLYYPSFWMKPKSELDTLIPLYYPNVKLIGFNSPSGPIQPVLKKTTNPSRK